MRPPGISGPRAFGGPVYQRFLTTKAIIYVLFLVTMAKKKIFVSKLITPRSKRNIMENRRSLGMISAWMEHVDDQSLGLKLEVRGF